MCASNVSNVIYKFSQGAAFYTLNGKNVKVLLELNFISNKQERYNLFTARYTFKFLYNIKFKSNKSNLLDISKLNFSSNYRYLKVSFLLWLIASVSNRGLKHIIKLSVSVGML